MPAKKWEHPELGSFRCERDYGETRWIGTVELPAFSVFRFRGTRPFRGTKRIELAFESFADEEEMFVPSKVMARLALKIVANQEKLAKKIKQAYFDELWGKGPNSGMWWHGDEEARQYCADVLQKRVKRTTIASPDDFELLLGDPSIQITDDEASPKQFARISFGSAFEDEHGTEALTDGTKIVGIGYEGEASLFRGS